MNDNEELMTELTTNKVRKAAAFFFPTTESGNAAFDRWLAAYEGEILASDDRVARYLSMVSALGYESALSVVEAMISLITSENTARLHAGHKYCDTVLGCITSWADFPKEEER